MRPSHTTQISTARVLAATAIAGAVALTAAA